MNTTPENTTPEIEAILNDLTDLCCSAMTSENGLNVTRMQELVTSLSINGWERHSNKKAPLSAILKSRIKDHCKEPAIHRGAEIDGVVAKVQRAYNRASWLDASAPSDNNKSSQAMPPRSNA